MNTFGVLTKLSGQKNNSISLNWKPYNVKCSILYTLPTGHYKSWIAIFPSHAKKSPPPNTFAIVSVAVKKFYKVAFQFLVHVSYLGQKLVLSKELIKKYNSYNIFEWICMPLCFNPIVM